MKERPNLAEQVAEIPEETLAKAIRQWPMLSDLVALGAGYVSCAASQIWRPRPRPDSALLVYCANGGGWCQLKGRVHPVRKGDLLILPPELAYRCGARSANPWSFHYLEARGSRLPDYLDALGEDRPVQAVNPPVQLVGLFNQVYRDLVSPRVPWNVFHAAHTLGHLLSWLIQQRQNTPAEHEAGVHRIAQIIDFMNENLQDNVNVRRLASLIGLSPAHFSVEFKRVTGSSPRDYLHLLRMHRAIQWVTETELSVKEIAARLGYQDPFHFSRQFKSFSGMAPRDYRLARPRGYTS